VICCKRELNLPRSSSFKIIISISFKKILSSVLCLDIIFADDIVFENTPPMPVQIESGRNVTISGPGRI